MPTNETQLERIDIKPPVQVRSMRDGLLFILDEQCEFAGLIDHIHDLLHGETQSVFDGPEVRVAVDYGARNLSRDEIRSLLDVFLRKENFLISEWGPNTAARRTMLQSRARPSGQHIFKGTVRAGQRLVFEGDVVIIGDVHPGGEVVASGDVYVFGKLAGTAHSGASGDMGTVIAAAEFVPMQLRIGTIISRAPEEKGKLLHTFMEFAYIRDDGMAVDKLEFLTSIRRRAIGTVANEGEAL